MIKNIYYCGENELCEPITITCPYCNASIPQDERVECSCGFTGIAMPSVINEMMFDICPDDYEFKNDEYYSFKEKWNLHYINSIHWLELQAGKDGAE